MEILPMAVTKGNRSNQLVYTKTQKSGSKRPGRGTTLIPCASGEEPFSVRKTEDDLLSRSEDEANESTLSRRLLAGFQEIPDRGKKLNWVAASLLVVDVLS
jgi:hypothetical protein